MSHFENSDSCKTCGGTINVDPRTSLCPDCEPIVPQWPMNEKLKELMVRERR